MIDLIFSSMHETRDDRRNVAEGWEIFLVEKKMTLLQHLKDKPCPMDTNG
jgi:hypothetical protein